jgi:hypothetical protein
MPENLYCIKCKALRPFSGMPSACKNCGWVYSVEAVAMFTNMRAIVTPTSSTPSPPVQKAKATGDTFGGLIALFGVGLVFVFYAGCAVIFIALLVWAWRHLFG